MRPPSFLLIASITFGCGPAPEEIVDIDPPIIEILSPQRNFMYKPADTVFINALVTDSQLIRNLSVHIHDLFLPPSEDTVFSFSACLRRPVYEIDTFFVVNDPVDKNYALYITADDPAENLAERKRYFYQFH